MILGSHLSIAGGLHRALEAAEGYGFEAVALFLRNQQQWKAPELTDQAVRTFKRIRKRVGIAPVVAHGSYLLNLAGRDEVREKSILALAEDLRRAGRLGVEYFVIHPGSNPDTEAGIERIIDGLDAAMHGLRHRHPVLLLETTAGQGNCVGHRFEHLAAVLSGVRRRDRYGVCFDTAHVFAAGYDLRTAKACRATLAEFDAVVGLERLRAIHCNDSKRALGARVDRHEHIGMGEIGLGGFRSLVNDARLADVPFILETPKGTRESDNADWDDVNAATLRQLVRRTKA
jgi:deoxyribonuclease-4